MVGRDETERLSSQNRIPASVPNTAGTVAIPVACLNTVDPSGYSMWTSRAVGHIMTSVSVSVSADGGGGGGGGGGGYGGYKTDDDMIPFSDTPQISRFGPISRRGASIMRSSQPSQSQAIMGDEPSPISVVRHSKHMSKPAPPSASLLLQNGGLTTLQPVTIGENGEIGYIAVQQNPPPPPTMTMIEPPAASEAASAAMDPASVYAESERMRHELEILQQKISNLNMAQQHNQAAAMNNR
jgi:hypothetical protein